MVFIARGTNTSQWTASDKLYQTLLILRWYVLKTPKTCRSAKGCSQIANFGEDLAQRRAGFVQNFESGPDRKGTNHFLIPSLLEWRGDKSDRENAAAGHRGKTCRGCISANKRDRRTASVAESGRFIRLGTRHNFPRRRRFGASLNVKLEAGRVGVKRPWRRLICARRGARHTAAEEMAEIGRRAEIRNGLRRILHDADARSDDAGRSTTC